MSLLPFLHRIADREDLTCTEALQAMEIILSGQASPAQVAGFLLALRMKGETVEELVGFARAMRRMAVPLDLEWNGEKLLDTCGTGGDGLSTFNISTIAAFVAAGAGVRVAKHGNRSISSKCGSADLLESLGVPVSMQLAEAARAIREVGIGFLFAPLAHTAMKHAQPVRIDLKMRTVFNLLGPLTNPVGASSQLVGAPSARAAELMAGALAALELDHGFVVHGSDGLDEITTTGPTLLFEVRRGSVTRRTVDLEDFGVGRARPEDLKGGDKEANGVIARAVLSGERGPKRDIVLVNAAAALVAAGKAEGFREGVAIAEQSIDSGAALAKVEELVRFWR
ncbi:MAG TPA: anthranilate phosphoribosyltransferase [Bryobacteraceae bacterium]|nr:anthranilate phosphoribosyltransferase [Bryobacteraceae bacterium]